MKCSHWNVCNYQSQINVNSIWSSIVYLRAFFTFVCLWCNCCRFTKLIRREVFNVEKKSLPFKKWRDICKIWYFLVWNGIDDVKVILSYWLNCLWQCFVTFVPFGFQVLGIIPSHIMSQLYICVSCVFFVTFVPLVLASRAKCQQQRALFSGAKGHLYIFVVDIFWLFYIYWQKSLNKFAFFSLSKHQFSLISIVNWMKTMVF